MPDMYLGCVNYLVETIYGAKYWAISSEKYLKTNIRKLEETLEKSNQRLPNKCSNTFVTG